MLLCSCCGLSTELKLHSRILILLLTNFDSSFGLNYYEVRKLGACSYSANTTKGISYEEC